MKLPEHVFATLQRLRPDFPMPLGSHGAALLNAVAREHPGWGLEAKSGGTTCPQPQTGIPCACDILRTNAYGWDVLIDAEGAGTPVRSESGPADPLRFVVPVNPIDPPSPPPPPPDFVARIAVLEQQVSALQLHERQLRDDLVALQVRLDRLEAAPSLPPLAKLRVKGATGRTASHAHAIDLPLTVIP